MIESYNSETLPSTWISDRDVYAEGATPTVGAQVVYALETPVVYDISPQEIAMITGQNTIYSSTGQTAISYYDDQTSTEPYVDYTTTSVLEISADALSTATNIDNRTKAIMGICTTSATVLNKVVTCENFKIYPGVRIQVYFSNANTATNGLLTLNVNNTGNVGIYVCDNQVNSYNQLLWGSAGVSITFVLVKNNSNSIYWKALDTPYPLYGTCNTEADVQAKVVGCSRPVICKGTSISIKMTNTNTAEAATLNVASTGGKTIYANNEPLTVNSRFNWRANTVQKFVFDGQYWRMDDDSVKMLATAYITEIDEDGIMVHPEDDSTSGWAISDAIQLFKNGISYIKLWIDNNIPKIRLGKEDQGHLMLDEDSVDVMNGSTAIASFGESTIIGENNKTHIEIDYHSLQLIDSNGNTYFHVSDLRNKDGEYETTDTFIGDNSARTFSLIYPAKDTDYTVTVDGEEVTDGITKYKSSVFFTTAPIDKSVIKVNYVTNSSMAKGYTIGTRKNNSIIGARSLAEGYNVTASGSYSHAGGYYTTAQGEGSHAEGSDTVASGFSSHAEGSNTEAQNESSHAEGHFTIASGFSSHAEGSITTAQGEGSHAEGLYNTTASGNGSHAEGISTMASGESSHAEGSNTVASGVGSHAGGISTTAASYAQTAIGKYNKEDSLEKYGLIIGNGVQNPNNSVIQRSNAFAVTWDGNVELALDTAATSGTTDGDLYNTITALGWGNDVII